ncbi:MAG: DUF4867 family protein [Spirochaetales bacterium]|nr:MAG: DUF4867 family protein [Spirochaetales bacterium]
MDKNVHKLNMLNPDIGIHSIEDHGFQSYGRILRSVRTEALLSLIEELTPGNEVIYESEIPHAERATGNLSFFAKEVFDGNADLQVGAVYGRNTRINALEYHKCAEVIIAALPMVIMTGLVCEIEWPKGTFDLSRIRAFYVPGGTALELPPWCLHYVPIHVYEEDGFKCLVILPRGTNLPLDYEPEREGEGKLMLARNKWLLAHPDDQTFSGSAAHFGLVGRNIELKTL